MSQCVSSEIPTAPPDPEKKNPAASGVANGVSGFEAAKLQDGVYANRAAVSTVDEFTALLDAPAPFALTLFDSKTDTGKRETRLTLPALAELVSQPHAASKGALPLLKLATFGEERHGRAALRNDGNVIAVTGIEGDYDGEAVSLADAETRLRAAGLSALLYSSPSHRADAPRWRVLCPLARPVPPEEREALTARLNGALGGILAPESFKLSSAYFYGATAGGHPIETRTVDGQSLDTLPHLPSIGRALTGKATEADHRAAIARCEALHDSTLALIGIGAARGDTAEETTAAVRTAMEAVPEAQRDRRWRDRYKDLPRCVADVFKAEGRKPSIVDAFDDLPDPPPKHGRLRFLTPSDCADAPARGYVVKGLFAPGDVGCIFGAPGAGKSLIAPHLGYAVAQGSAAFGMRTKAGRVFYVAAEDPAGMRGRVSALQIRHGDAPQFVLVEGVSDLLATDAPDLAALQSAVASQAPALVFIDTLAMAFPGLEENSADAMGRVVAIARRLAEGGAAVVLIHHDTKAQGPTPRGHSLLNGALDVALQLFPRDEDGVVRGKLTKNRNGSCDRDIAFRIATEDMGRDEDGDRITYAVVRELASGDAQHRTPRITGSERAAFDILKTLGPGATEEAWRDACIDARTVSASDNRDSRQKATKRAFEGLTRKGVVRITNGVAVPILGHDRFVSVTDFEHPFDDLPDEASA